MKIISQHRALVALAAASWAAAVAQADSALLAAAWELHPATEVVEAVPPLPPPTTFPVQLVLDDDSSEGVLGVAGATARQFLWFNRFTAGAGFHLEEVWVLFPSGANMAVGGAIQIAIYEDPDGDPSNGANLLASFNDTIQAADDNTFSLYTVPGAPTIPDGSDLLVGVVPRFIVSGVTSPTFPAALDTTATQGRSWLAAWSTDPPDPPVLVPLPDQTLSLVDDFFPGGGNFMIRAFGSPQGVTEIPALDGLGLAALALALLAAGAFVLRRRKAAAAIALLLLALAAPAAAVTIDTFTATQAAISDPGTVSSSVAGVAGDPIGTNRGMVVDLLTGAGPTTASVAGGNLVLAVTATTPDSRGEVLVSWDGDTNALVLSPTGLANANLTTGNASGIQLDFVSTTVVTEVEITVYDDAANFSRAARRVPISGAAQSVRIPFAEFRVAGGTGANFASVGAIEMTVRGSEGTITLNQVTTTAPTVAATKVDALLIDNDGDTRADPGDRVRYTVTATNTGNQALAVDLTDMVDANTTLVAGSVSSTPVAHNDQYGWFGNVTLSADGTPFPTLLANDADGDNDPLTVTAFDATTAQGGSITGVIAATGEFTYNPPAGFAGVDSFNYTISDNDAHTMTATAYIALEGVVWFVDDSNTTPPHSGTLADPFQTLASVNGVDPDQPGDIIFLYDDNGTAYPGGHVMEADQQFLGEGVGLILSGTTIVPVGGTPQMTNAAGAAITLGLNSTIRGLDVTNASGAGIVGTSFGTFTASSVNVTGVGGATLDLATGTLATTFGTLSSAGTAGQRGLQLVTVAGSLTATTTTLTNPSTQGIRVATSPAVVLDFGNTTITDSAVGGPTGTGIDIATGNAGASFTFDSLAVTTDAGAGLVANGSGTVNIGGTGNTIIATGGAALDISSTSLGSGATFATVTSTNSSAKGINLNTVTGALTMNGGSLTGSGTIAFDLNAGSANVTYAGSITHTSNNAMVEITSRTGGTTTLSGNLSATGSSDGIRVLSNSGGTYNFSGTTKTLNTGADIAVSLTTNGGSTINFTNGGLAITTTSGTGFNATGGATAITVQGTANTIASTTGTALNVANTTIGGSHLNFQSISSNGASSGIVLNNSGAGGLKVTGNTSGNCGGSITLNSPGTPHGVGAPVTGDCSGGTIQASTGAGISLTNTDNVGLTRMYILNSGTDGILINDVNGFTLDRSYVTDASGIAGDRGIEMGDFSTGTAVNGTINITNSTLGPTPHDNMGVGIGSGTSAWSITSTVFTGSVLNSGFNFEIRNATVSNLLIDDSVMQNHFADGMQMQPASGVAATITSATIQDSSFTGDNIGIDLNHDGTSNVTYRVLNNTFQMQVAQAINFFTSATAGTGGTMNGRFDNNFIGNSAIFNSGGGMGIRVNVNGGADTTVLLNGNTIRQIPNGRGIEIISRNGTGGTDATVTSNFVNTDFVPTVPNGGFSLSNIFLQSNCLATCNTLRSDIRTNTVPAVAPNGELVAGQLVLIRTGASTNQLVDNAPVSPDAASEIASHNTGSTATSGTITLIAGPISTPP